MCYMRENIVSGIHSYEELTKRVAETAESCVIYSSKWHLEPNENK